MPLLVIAQVVETIQPVKPEWRPRSVIFHPRGGGVIVRDAMLYGTLAVHASWIWPESEPLPYRPVTITHYPSRLAMARVEHLDEAMAQAEWLWDQCPRVWVEEVVDRNRVPKEVVKWCLEMTKELRR